MSNCEKCERTECAEVMTEKKPETVPYIVYEAALDRDTYNQHDLLHEQYGGITESTYFLCQKKVD